MVKMVAFVKRRAGLDRQVFLNYWRQEHLSLVKELPGLILARTNVGLVIREREPGYDLIAEAYWENAEALRAAYTSPAGQAVAESLARVSDPAQTVSAILAERTVLPPPAGGPFLKNFFILHRRPDLSPAEFDRYWWEEHPKVVTPLPGLRGYIQCPVVNLPGETPAIDGCAILWFDSLDALRGASRSEEMVAARADWQHFLDEERILAVAAMEE